MEFFGTVLEFLHVAATVLQLQGSTHSCGLSAMSRSGALKQNKRGGGDSKVSTPGSRFNSGVFRSFETIEDWLRDPEWNPDTELTEQEAKEAFRKLRESGRASKRWRAPAQNEQVDDIELDEEKLEKFFAEAKRNELEKFYALDARVRLAEKVIEQKLEPQFPDRLLKQEDEKAILRPFSPPKEETAPKSTGMVIMANVEQQQQLLQEQQRIQTYSSSGPIGSELISKRFVIRRHGELRLARVIRREIQLCSCEGHEVERVPILSDQGEIDCHQDLLRAIQDSDAVARVLPKLALVSRISEQELWKHV